MEFAMAYKRVLACFTIVCAILCGLAAPGLTDGPPFPEFTIVKPNVSFWINIYTRYTTTQAVVHDSVDLTIVYDVIDLLPPDMPGARKTNRRRMKMASQTYTHILQRLVADPSTQDADCRRVASLFAQRAGGNIFQQASHRVRCQVGQRDRFLKGLVRSGAYIDKIRAILASYGVPADLAYLPHVESSFDIQAYSKFGAAGMWQFTRSTGRRFLTVNYLLDERRDPIAATHAAAQLLKENHAKLGSWPLAITAYNHGAAGMQRAKAIHGDYPSIFSEYNGRTFKFASRNFYSEFLAARKIASDHRRYFGEIDLADPVTFQSVRLEGFAGFVELCRHLGFDPHTVRGINPALRPPVLSGQKLIPRDYRLHLPGTAAFDSDGRLADLLPDIYQNAQKPSRFYTVQRGDTAGSIARMHHVRLDDLVMANNLNHRATVYIRQRLRIPQPGAPIVPKKDALPRTTDKTLSVVAAAESQGDMARILASIPVDGEWGRYRRPGPAPADLIARLDPEIDQPALHGQAPVADLQPTAVRAQVAFSRIEEDPRQPVGTIHVEVEETIGHYAEWAGVRASRIRRLNQIPFGKPLQLHQAIQIPLDRIPADAFEARRLSFHEKLQKDFFACFRVEAVQQYRVQPGDSYWTLCHKKFDLPLWLLRHYNQDVNLAALQANQSLAIPAIQSIVQDSAVGFDATASPDA
jgi:membrane-bound lytic murein transglycosylase D